MHDTHIVLGTKVDAFNKRNLMRLCPMVYEDNLWKRQSFGRLSKSGDLKLIRHFLQRQVHFVVHSKDEIRKMQTMWFQMVALAFGLAVLGKVAGSLISTLLQMFGI